MNQEERDGSLFGFCDRDSKVKLTLVKFLKEVVKSGIDLFNLRKVCGSQPPKLSLVELCGIGSASDGIMVQKYSSAKAWQVYGKIIPRRRVES